MRGTALTVGLLALGMPLCSTAGAILFNELPMQNANGVTVDGVTFDYSDPLDSLAIYGYSLGIPMDNLSDPVLFGDTSGVLTMSFADPTPSLSFDIALTTANSVADAYNVALSFQGTGVYSQSFDLDPQFILAEGVFSYSGTPIDFATVTFPNTVDSSENPVASFAIDNVASLGAPEPGAAFLLASGLLTFGALARRRLRNRA